MTDNNKNSIDSDFPGRLPKPAHPLPKEETEDLEEKARLIAQILELQNTLEDLSQRFDNVKDECSKLKAENQVLSQYIKNLMASSTLFHPANSKSTIIKTPSNELFDDYCW